MQIITQPGTSCAIRVVSSDSAYMWRFGVINFAAGSKPDRVMIGRDLLECRS